MDLSGWYQNINPRGQIIDYSNVDEYVSETLGKDSVFKLTCELFNVMPPFNSFFMFSNFGHDKVGFQYLRSDYYVTSEDNPFLVKSYVTSNREIVNPCDFHIEINSSGKLVLQDGGGTFLFHDNKLKYPNEDLKKKGMHLIVSAFCASLVAIQFMHCKNIQAKEHDPNELLTRQVKRNMERKSVEPLKKYYTLNIEPLKKVFKSDGNIEQNGLKKALHICRGHFKTYEEKGLFGKYKGTFWIPQHIKGNSENGEVIKKYNVKL